jgi:hypothetical protein
MTVVQLRRLLDTISRQRLALGRADEAEALTKLADVLRPTDKLSVSKAVEKIRN